MGLEIKLEPPEIMPQEPKIKLEQPEVKVETPEFKVRVPKIKLEKREIKVEEPAPNSPGAFKMPYGPAWAQDPRTSKKWRNKRLFGYSKNRRKPKVKPDTTL